MNLFYQFAFFFSQSVRICRIYSREIGITQSIFFSFIYKDAAFKINLLQKFTISHSEFRTAVDDFSFQLKLDNGNGFMHLSNQTQSLLIIMSIGKVHFRHENRARIIGIRIHCKSSQWKQIDSVSVFKCPQITIAHRHTYHVSDTTIITGSCSHPKNIMISPLNIEVVVITQCIHNDMCTGTTVVNITYDMKRINSQTLNQITHSDNEIVGTLRSDYCADNYINISMLIRFDRRFVQ